MPHIDPQSIGVGLYQHDVDQRRLGQRLDSVVESVVNYVGVDLNTASPSLLGYVAGLKASTRENVKEGQIVKGSDKTALIDTVDPPMKDVLFHNLEQLDISRIGDP